jgi:TetR/AcrR family transcriptional regulator, transcriptional repressor for nem operon
VRKGEQTRQEIIRKAAPIFNQKGYEGTALSDLMQATGLEKGGIYRHFDSKQKLAGEAFDHAWKVAMAARFEGLDKIPNAVDRLRQFLRNFQERRHGLVPGGCPLLNTAIESDEGNPRLRGKARQLTTRAITLSAGIFALLSGDFSRSDRIRNNPQVHR